MKKQAYFDFIDTTLTDLVTLIKAKNSDYTAGADDAFANFRTSEDVGISTFDGLVVRLLDKVQRVKSFTKQGALQVKGEGVEDAFKDLIGYSLLALGMLEESREQVAANSTSNMEKLERREPDWTKVSIMANTIEQRGLVANWLARKVGKDVSYLSSFPTLNIIRLGRADYVSNFDDAPSSHTKMSYSEWASDHADTRS